MSRFYTSCDNLHESLLHLMQMR